MLQGYKVVFPYRLKRNKFYHSAIYGHVLYKIDCISEPYKYCGPLAVFTNLQEAMKFAKSAHFKIFKCDYVQSKEKYLYLSSDPLHKVDILDLQPGVDFADEVTLREEV